jgi:hypothetical protein
MWGPRLCSLTINEVSVRGINAIKLSDRDCWLALVSFTSFQWIYLKLIDLQFSFGHETRSKGVNIWVSCSFCRPARATRRLILPPSCVSWRRSAVLLASQYQFHVNTDLWIVLVFAMRCCPVVKVKRFFLLKTHALKPAACSSRTLWQGVQKIKNFRQSYLQQFLGQYSVSP